jgi:hypothetical protein
MAQTLTLPNSLALTPQQTRLTADAPVSSSTLTVENTAGFSATDFFTIGNFGSETAELLTITSTTGANTITPTASTSFAHLSGEAVLRLFGSKLRVYRAANVNGQPAADDTFTLLATIDIQVDQTGTEYTDADGGEGYWYKYTCYNPTSGSETSLSDSQAVRGGNVGNYCSIADIRQEAGFMYAPYITDDMIDQKRQAAQREIDGALVGIYAVPFTPPINPFIADICKRLAAGLLLLEQYGAIKRKDNTDGQSKVDGARADIQRILNPQGADGITLTDGTGTPIALTNPNTSVSGWPNETTATASRYAGGAHRAFRMSMNEGYYSREF